jgi:hypothetical protein
MRADKPTIHDRMREIRSLVNEGRKHYELTQNKGKFSQVCSSLDAIEDSEQAIAAFGRSDFGDDVALGYLVIYGVLQATFLQQDAAWNLCDAIGVPKDKAAYPSLAELREIRNASIGHPTKQDHKKPTAYSHITQMTMSIRGFDLLTFKADGSYEPRQVDLPRLLADAIKEHISPPVSVCLLDARRAVQFVRLHAAEWHLDPDRIAVAGGSQGALPALYVGCAGEKADPNSTDPVERVSTKVTCVGAWRSQPSIDPKRMQEWVPGVQWGVPAWGCSFAESLRRRDELLPLISKWSPEALVGKDLPPIYFEYDWGLTKPDRVGEMDYLVHSPRWGLGFQKVAQEHGATCYLRFPGHPSEKYADMWDFLLRELGVGSKEAAMPKSAAAPRIAGPYVRVYAPGADARAGNDLLSKHGRDRKAKLKKLANLDWSRSNSRLWEGREMNAGRLSKRNVNVTLTGNLIKQHLGLPLSPDEQELERQFRRSSNGRIASRKKQ